MFYLYTINDSDGNDNTVYDCIIEADSRDAADSIVSEHFEAQAKEKDWELDGYVWGYFYPCDCEVPELPEEEIPCPQCQMLSINGVACHETGCPVEAKLNRVQAEIDNFECPGHGGISVNEDAEEFSTEEQAEEATAYYHARYRIQ